MIVNTNEKNNDILSLLPVVTTEAAAVASFDDGADSVPAKVVVNIEPVQEGSGDPSPENVRSFSPLTNINIEQRGKNMIVPDNPDNPMQNYTHTSSGTIRYSAEYEAFYSYGPGIAEDKRAGYQKMFIAPADMTVTFSIDTYNQGTDYGIRFYAKGSRVKDIHGALNKWEHYTYTVSLKKGQSISCSYYGKIFWKNVQIVVGSSADQYYPYVKETIPINWESVAGSIYGGILTINEDDSATLSAYPYYAAYNGETLIGPWVSSMDVYAEGATPTTGAEVVDLGGATTDYTLTAEALATLLGDNTIWSDAGNIAVTYRADIPITIQNLKNAIVSLGGNV